MKEEISFSTKMEENKLEISRGTWDHKFESILSCMGYCIGLGNVWRFPYLCYKNGGAAFLIPYFIMLFFACLPLLFTELVIGQYSSLGPVKLFASMSPISSGLGQSNIVISIFVSTFYVLIQAWSLFYLFASFSNVLPWSNCTNEFNGLECYTRTAADVCQNQSLYYYNHTCESPSNYCALGGHVLHNQTHCQDDSGEKIIIDNSLHRITSEEDYFKNYMLGSTGHDWDNMGGIRWEIVGCLALTWVVIAGSLSRGIKSSGKVVYFTVLFPYVVLVILLVRGLTLDGAYEGIEFYLLKPNMTKLQEPEVWMDAASQIFFSTGVAFGIFVTYASYNKFHNNCMEDAFIFVLSNSLTSIFSGLVIFSMLGFLANELGVAVDEVVDAGHGLAFIVYPALVSRMPVPQLWSVLFFSMLFTLGLDTLMASTETIATSLMDHFPKLRKYKIVTVCLLCLSMFLCGIIFCLEGSIHIFNLFDKFAVGINLLFLGIIEIIVVHYIFGFKNFMRLAKKEIGIRMPKLLEFYWEITLRIITPISLLLILVFSLWSTTPASDGDYIYPTRIQIMGWMLVVLSICLVPLNAILNYFVSKGSLFKLTADFCPATVRNNNAE